MYRKEKLESIIHEELSKLIKRHIATSALITITSVVLSKKLDEGTIWIAILPEEKEEEALALLKRNAKELRHLLLKKLTIRVVPYLTFKIDAGVKNVAAVEEALLKRNN